MMNKILVPIDGSEHSDRVLNYALDLAEKFSAEITKTNRVSENEESFQVYVAITHSLKLPFCR